jgi:hypothetical protein
MRTVHGTVSQYGFLSIAVGAQLQYYNFETKNKLKINYNLNSIQSPICFSTFFGLQFKFLMNEASVKVVALWWCTSKHVGRPRS